MKRLIALLAVCLALPVVAQNPPPGRPEPGPWVYGPRDRWDQSWNQRPNPRRGACFFTTAPFQGNRFCVRSGDKLPSLPENFGDNISSIQTYGGARVRVFNDRGFSGGSTMVRGSVADLRQLPFRGGHTWNNRISSLMVF
jgi:hypothetical protein